MLNSRGCNNLSWQFEAAAAEARTLLDGFDLTSVRSAIFSAHFGDHERLHKTFAITLSDCFQQLEVSAAFINNEAWS